ncbi:PREDICTED: putative fatty acyl-CoA reductase CG5065 [Nicrophorus vespilloides]|uniref:Fatty acyl-CoA reductase n=1 Tax=Nicrophorus vespilloides TaxID=110193 RepID=A0ABM1M3M9_NICVS|nr:PREDICTED: putative fatty acyl-CoA reductase CG5065 [Nicrophorus vespilloides]
MFDRVMDVYKGKHIFITGGTGFMGKVLIEKLLRSCPQISAIYLLVRAKRGKEPKQRLQDFIKTPLFAALQNDPKSDELFGKLHCMEGDLMLENLNLSNDDYQLLCENVDVVFHMAANVRFDQPLKTALNLNTGGTLRCLQMASNLRNLKAFVHVSTSYCHCDQTVLEEKVYKAPHDPRRMLDLVSWMDEELIELLAPKLLQNSPNTYAYTKCLTEQLVSEYAKILPIAIARPSIVTACFKDPIPGWVDNFNGPTGLLIGAGKGVIRTMHCDPNLPTDLIPVDMAINGLILIAKELLENRPINQEPLVIHLTSGKDNQITWGDAVETGRKHFYENPFSVCLWYPGGSIKSNYILHMICVLLFHMIPAYFVDFILILTRGKPFLVRTQKRIQSGLEILQYYTVRPWYFKNEGLKRLSGKLSTKDRAEFYVDFFEIDWDKYILNSVLGARLFCVKETIDTLPKARKLLKRLYYLDMTKNFVLLALVVWFLASWSSWIIKYTELVNIF